MYFSLWIFYLFAVFGLAIYNNCLHILTDLMYLCITNQHFIVDSINIAITVYIYALHLAKKSLDILLTTITKTVNKSLLLDAFTRILESYLSKTVNLKISLNCNIPNNYKTVSHITFSSNDVETVVVFHVSKYLVNTNLNESLKSAYVAGYKTETTLIKVK